MKEVPKTDTVRHCVICGGVIVRRTNVAMRRGYEDEDQPMLHLREEDWENNPHNAQEYLETKSGKKLYYSDFVALADEAEKGYDITKLLDKANKVDAKRTRSEAHELGGEG